MVGIVGIIEKQRSPDSSFALEQLVKALSRPICSSGSLTLEKAGAHLGWVCRKGSFSDCLPVWNEARNICLIFTGENFLDRADLDELKRKGHVFDKENASSLVHLYEEWGEDFLLRLNGIFSGLLVDLREEKVILFNDRYGLGRVYFHENEQGFYFASEAKALLKIVPALRTVDPVALSEFFVCGCPLENRSLFSGRPSPSRRCRMDLARASARDLSGLLRSGRLGGAAGAFGGTFYERLKEVFTRIVPSYFVGPQSVAMSITGGLDSRMIMAALRAPANSIRCYTFGGMSRECADVKVGRALAKACGQPFDVLPLTPDFFSQFPQLAMDAVRLTDGAMDVSGAANIYLNRLAREVAPVRMTGNYGGEILRGITGLKAQPVDESLFDPEFVSNCEQSPPLLPDARQTVLQSFIAFKQVPWLHFGMLAVEQSQMTVRTPYLDNELVALSYQAPPELIRTRISRSATSRNPIRASPLCRMIAEPFGSRTGPLGDPVLAFAICAKSFSPRQNTFLTTGCQIGLHASTGFFLPCTPSDSS